MAPLGIPKFNITFSFVPPFVTVALVPGLVVVVVPTVIVAAPLGPVGPVGPIKAIFSLQILPSSKMRFIFFEYPFMFSPLQ